MDLLHIPSLVVWMPFLLLVVLLLRGTRAKKVFGIPWYVLFIGGDIGRRKAYIIKKSILKGAPDALFFDVFKWRYIVCEFKSRTSYYPPTKIELNQCLLYMGVVNKFYHAAPICVLCYGNGQRHCIAFNKYEFRRMYKQRYELLKVINKF